MTTCTLGFGCASIQGRVGRRQSLEALAAAYDAGIRHFDIARSYGWGKAEGLLGEFLQGRPRQDYTLVTKCGILPSKPSHLKSAARTVAQQVFRLVPASRGLVRRVAASSSQPSRTTDIGVLSKSLDDSLHALRTDYVDTLLLHNFTPDYPELGRVIEFFERKKDEGKVRRYGFSVEGDLTAGLKRLGGAGIEGEVLVQAPVSAELLALSASSVGVRVHANGLFRFLSDRGLGATETPALFAALVRRSPCEAVICSMMSSGHAQENLRNMRAAQSVGDEAVDALLKRVAPTPPVGA